MKVTPKLGAKGAKSHFDFAACSQAELERDEGAPRNSAASVLFTSTQRRLLGFLNGQPDRDFHFGELVARTGSGDGATQRELARLEGAGLLAHSYVGARKYYCANTAAPVYPELRALVQHSFGLAEPLREAFADFEQRFALLFVHGPVTRSLSPLLALEMMAVLRDGDWAPEEGVGFALAQAEQRLGRALVLPRILRPGELRNPDAYVAKVLEQSRIWVFGHETGLATVTSGP